MPTAQGDIATSYVGQNRAVLQGLHTAQAATAAAIAAGPRRVRLQTAQNGTGAQTVFNVAHGLNGTPVDFNLEARTAVAGAAHGITADATNLIVTFAAAPAAGTGNVSFAGYAAL